MCFKREFRTLLPGTWYPVPRYGIQYMRGDNCRRRTNIYTCYIKWNSRITVPRLFVLQGSRFQRLTDGPMNLWGVWNIRVGIIAAIVHTCIYYVKSNGTLVPLRLHYLFVF